MFVFVSKLYIYMVLKYIIIIIIIIILVPGKVSIFRLLGSTRNFRPEVPGSTRKFLPFARTSWFLPGSLLMMAHFLPKRNETIV